MAAAEVQQLLHDIDVESTSMPKTDEARWLYDDHRWFPNRTKPASKACELPFREPECQDQLEGLNEFLRDPAADLDDNVLRYSFKGKPPEVYSSKKEFIYTPALVDKQVNTST